MNTSWDCINVNKIYAAVMHDKPAKLQDHWSFIYFYLCHITELADNLDYKNISVSNESYLGRVFIRWNDPPSPNGVIVTYEIELSRPNTPNVSQLYIHVYCFSLL